jgi:sugar lactone lactonase YvrE
MRCAVLVVLSLSLTAPHLAAQDLVVNYLGGPASKAGSSFGAIVTEKAAIGVSPDGRLLYVALPADAAVLRYDLRARTVERIPVPGLTQSAVISSQSVTSITVSDDGTALIPVGRQIARIGLDGKITTPGFAFTAQNSDLFPVNLRAIAHPNTGPGRNTTLAIQGIQSGNNRFWAPLSATFANYYGDLGNCFSNVCNNTALAPDTPSGNFRSSQPWGLAVERVIANNIQSLSVYFTDNGGQYPANGAVAVLRRPTMLTVLGHPAMTTIPPGSSGERLSGPTGLVLDLSGNLLVADTGNHRILRRTPAGVWSIFAGTGGRGSRGDGGPATSAELFEPKSLAIDASGTVYVHDSGNGFFRRILPTGIIERINLDPGQNASESLIQDIQLPQVSALATDAAGQIYAAGQNRILKVDPRGRATSIAGTGQRGRSPDGAVAADSPIDTILGLTVDAEARVVFSEPLRIRRIEPSGIVNTIAGNGSQRPVEQTRFDPDPAPALATFMSPTSVSTAPDDSLLFFDGSWLRRLRDGKLSSVTGVPWCGGFAGGKFADGVPAIFTCTNANGGLPKIILANAEGRLYFDDNGTSLRTIDPEGFVSTLATLQGLKIGAMAPGPNNSVYALVNRTTITAQTTAANLLLRIAANGEITRLSRDTISSPQVIPVRPGQPSTELVIYNSDLLATDNRGFLYTWDFSTRRLIVFGESVTVDVDTSPSGLPVTIDGTRLVTPQRFRWLPGEYHTVLADPKANGADFQGWSHGASPSITSITWMPSGGPSRVVAKYSDSPALP